LAHFAVERKIGPVNHRGGPRMGKPSYEELEAENRWLRARVADLEEKVRRIEKALEGSLRRSKRQAAPFSKGPPKAKPKKPGRKAGDQYGQPARRDVPPT
jgi:hypothetical protein